MSIRDALLGVLYLVMLGGAAFAVLASLVRRFRR